MTTSIRNLVRTLPLPLPQSVHAWANALPLDISISHSPQYDAMMAEIAAACGLTEAEDSRYQLRKEDIDV